VVSIIARDHPKFDMGTKQHPAEEDQKSFDKWQDHYNHRVSLERDYSEGDKSD
jgi:hypothetical protein